jgi:hypothetical protein
MHVALGQRSLEQLERESSIAEDMRDEREVLRRNVSRADAVPVRLKSGPYGRMDVACGLDVVRRVRL